MTPVGPATEAGAPVVTAAPKNAEERLEYLMQLGTQAHHAYTGVRSPHVVFEDIIRDRMSQAARAWEHEVATAREEEREMLAIAHDRIAQLEETVERLGADLANARFRLDEARQNAQAASERHAIQSGEQRQTIAALAAQLVREMRRGGA